MRGYFFLLAVVRLWHYDIMQYGVLLYIIHKESYSSNHRFSTDNATTCRGKCEGNIFCVVYLVARVLIYK